MRKLATWLLLVLAFGVLSCGMRKSQSTSMAQQSTLQIVDPALNSQAMTILSRCTSCHSQASSADSLVASGWVVPGNANGSLLYTRVKDGSMAPGNPLSTSELATIASWINTALVIQTGPAPNPSSSPSPSPAPSGLSALGQKAYAVLQTNCAGCHGAGSVGSGGIGYILDFQKDIDNGIAIPGNAAGSSIYTTINAGTMPPGGKLAATDIQTIFDWIQTDLKSGSPTPAPSMVPLAATYTSISANLLVPKCTGCHGAVGAADGIRYDTYAHTLGTVKAGSPSTSSLYTSCAGGDMPQGSTKLTSAQLQAISDWITGGALNN
jgi:mono/diheme cytochrome c family protein